jgi:hypothetical protein
MKGYIYITKEFNSDGQELKHNGLTKIGIGKTNDLDRRFYEHSHRGSKATAGVQFIDNFEVSNMDKTERGIHTQLKRLGFEVVIRTSTNINSDSSSRTEVYSGLSNLDIDGVVKKGDEISEKLVKRLLKGIVSEEEFININLMTFRPHLLQEIIIRQILSLSIKNTTINAIAELCARFGKTLTYLELFKRMDDVDVMIIPAFVHSVFSSFEGEIVGKYQDENIGKWLNFNGFKVINTVTDTKWEEKFNKNLGNCKMVVFVSLQTPEENLQKFDVLQKLEGRRKFILIDEADFGAYTFKSKNVISYLNSDGDVPYKIKLITSGTGIDKASKIFIDEKIDDILSVSYTEMLLTKKGESKYFLDEYLDELTKDDKLVFDFLKEVQKDKTTWMNTLAYAPDVNFFKLTLPESHRIEIEKNLDEDLTGWNKLLSDVNKNINILKLIINGLWGKSKNVSLDSLAISNAIKKDPKVVHFFVASPNNEELEKLACLFKSQLPNHIVRILSGSNDVKNATAEAIVKNDIQQCKDENKEGVVILSMNMAARSFSIPEIDAVVLMFDNGSVSALVQKISRALTGGKDYYGNEKKEGNIISLSLDPNRVDAVDVFIVEESQKNKTKSETINSVIRRIRRSVNIFAIDDNGDTVNLLVNDDYYSELIEKFNFERLKNSQINILPLISDKELRDLLLNINSTDTNKKDSKTKELKSKGKKFVDDGGKDKDRDKEKDDYEFTKKDIEFLRQCVITINKCILSIVGIDDSFGKKSFRKTLESINSDNDKKLEFINLLGIVPNTVIKLLDKEVINENIIDLCLSKY